MNTRISLSTVFSTSGQRHAIPHDTFTAARDGDFFTYLNSNDTRLPQHRFLRAHARPAEEYDTYVDEEVWQQSEKEGEEGDAAAAGSSSSESDADDVLPHIQCDAVVDWVVRVLEEDWARDGVVLCGRYVVADDCTWAVPSRSPTLFSPHEIFMVMRNSSKFLEDVAAQVEDATHVQAEFTLAKAMAASGAKEMRALVPHRIVCGAGGELAATPLYHYTAICQRFTEVCFPSLMAWTETEHNEFYQLMMERLKKAALLERECALNKDFLPRLVASFQQRWKQGGREYYLGDAAETATAEEEVAPDALIALLGVDILFENASLPVNILSGRVRLFPGEAVGAASDAAAPEREGPADDDAPYILEPCEVPEERKEASKAWTGAACDEGVEGPVSSFMRLLRDEGNWNNYVEIMEGKDSEALRYCVVASEASDLLTCADTHAKRGLPIELLHPELLQGSPEGMAFLQKMREKMLSGGGTMM